MNAARAVTIVVFALASFVAASVTASCDGEEAPTGLGEPLRVVRGAFKSGALPGEPPPASPPGPIPAVTALETASTTFELGQSGKSLVGRTSPEAVAVAVRFVDLGSGYWVVPAGPIDPQANGERTWEALLDVGIDLPPGIHDLRVVAIDGNGHSGAQRALAICVPPLVPDNLNACDPTRTPPSAVVSLSWDVPVDLDLVVVGPDYRVLSAKTPRVSPDAGATDPSAPAPPVTTVPPGAVTLDRDSNGSCVPDGKRRENAVWLDAPPPGSYLLFANLFEACGRESVRYRMTVYQRGVAEDGVVRLLPTLERNGVAVAVEANGGASFGTFVSEVIF